MLALNGYGSGNLRSAEKALARVGATVRIVNRPAEVLAADAVVLPGVGAIANGQAQWVSGYVSAKKDEGLATETTLVSVTVNGVATTLGVVAADGNRAFTTTTAMPVTTDGAPTVLDVTMNWDNGRHARAGIGDQPAGICVNVSSYPVVVSGGDGFTINSNNFVWPSPVSATEEAITNTARGDMEIGVWNGSQLSFSGFHNAAPPLISVSGPSKLISLCDTSNPAPGIQLTAVLAAGVPSDGSFSWTVTTGSDKVQLDPNSVNTQTLILHGVAGSAKGGQDVTVKVTYQFHDLGRQQFKPHLKWK